MLPVYYIYRHLNQLFKLFFAMVNHCIVLRGRYLRGFFKAVAVKRDIACQEHVHAWQQLCTRQHVNV